MSHVVFASLLVCSVSLVAGGRAIEPGLDRAEIESALRLARSSEAERGRFHAGYQVPVPQREIESLEVITEYRRMVMTAEERISTGAWSYTVAIRNAEEALRPWVGKLTVRARVKFHPMKVYPRVPGIALFIGDPPNRVAPQQLTSLPLYALGTSTTAANPMTGAQIEGIFEARAVERRRQTVMILGPEELEVRVSADFGSLR
jgi:hypothetical protein